MEDLMKKAGWLMLLFASLSIGAAAQSGWAKAQAPEAQAGTSPKPQALPTQPSGAQDKKKEEDCGCEQKAPPDVLAVVNGIKIPTKEIDEPLKNKVDELRKQVIDARKQELNLEINTKLIDDEAKKRGITSSKLLDLEIVSKVKDPTEEEARAFYEQNKARIPGEFNAVKKDLIAYIRKEREREQALKLAEKLRAQSQVKMLVTEVTPPETAADRARILATVNGLNITSGEVEDFLRPVIFGVQDEIYKLRQKQLDLRINDLLLEQEAQKRKMTAKTLLDAEVTPNIKKVTEEDARAYYDKNKDKIKEDFASLKLRIIEYLQQTEEEAAEKSFAERLRKDASVQTFLAPPEQPVYAISTDDRPSRGKDTAPVTIVEFTDYQCPSCAYTQPIIEDILKEYGDRLRLVVRNFPLDMHQNAFKAAEAAEAAREQGKYWEYISILFHNQSALGPDKLKEYATQLGLDRAKFDAALDSGRFAERVQQDIQDGMKLGIDSTPTVFINGRRMQDQKNHDSIKAAVESALKDATAPRDSK
jgi:protein-disulfide isomerase